MLPEMTGITLSSSGSMAWGGLHEDLRTRSGTRCRIYAPVGAHRDLLAYLVRRLLENGANNSFVHQIVDESISPEDIACDPIDVAKEIRFSSNPSIPLPVDIFGDRCNAKGWNLNDPTDIAAIKRARSSFASPH